MACFQLTVRSVLYQTRCYDDKMPEEIPGVAAGRAPAGGEWPSTCVHPELVGQSTHNKPAGPLV
jgi:hypothetical protein